jgi:hypothetical protein
MRRKENSAGTHFLKNRGGTFREGEVPAVDAARICGKFAGQLLERAEPEKDFSRVVRKIADKRAVERSRLGNAQRAPFTGFRAIHVSQVRVNRRALPPVGAEHETGGSREHFRHDGTEYGHIRTKYT